jgi:hypothetical protein
MVQVFEVCPLGGEQMNKHNGNLINVIATGFVVVILFLLVLFWGRIFFLVKNLDKLPASSSEVIISPSGLVPGEPAPQQVESSDRSRMELPGPNEPNFRFSRVYRVYANINKESVFINAIGAFWDIAAVTMPFRDVNERVYYGYEDKTGYLCLDNRSGLIIRRYKTVELNDKSASMEEELFAGPNGISETASASLGRFYDPIVTEVWLEGSHSGIPSRIGLYDKRIRRFYVIDFAGGSVSKGLQLAEGDSREPIAIGIIKKELVAPGVVWNAPEIWNEANAKREPQGLFWDWDRTYTYIPVLDKTGRIHIYNTKEQTLTNAGYLPTPQSLFGTERLNEVANPRDVLDYDIQPVYAVRRLPGEGKKAGRVIDVKYLGMCVGSVSREGTAMTVAVFDPNGKLVYRGDTKSNGMSSVEFMYSSVSDEPLVTIFLFLLENLQPPVFEAASYLCAGCFEAGAGHRALFILPNSFLGMLGRYQGVHLDREVFLPLLMGPSLILSVWLAWKVRKDAALVGLSRAAKTWWIVGTIAFGLPAYITYRLTRHKEVLVTCQNCGNLRRPDMEKCHRCGSKWEMPELTPPNWRICD